MAYNTPETVADYLARFQMEITHRGKGTFTPDHVKYSLTIASGGKDFFTTFESNPHVHGEPTITQVFGALASDAMVVRDYGMVWKTAGMGLMVMPRKRMPRKRTIEMRSRL